MNTMAEIFPATCQVWIREKSSQMRILAHIISVSKSTKHRITRWHSNTHEYSYVCNTYMNTINSYTVTMPTHDTVLHDFGRQMLHIRIFVHGCILLCHICSCHITVSNPQAFVFTVAFNWIFLCMLYWWLSDDTYLHAHQWNHFFNSIQMHFELFVSKWLAGVFNHPLQTNIVQLTGMDTTWTEWVESAWVSLCLLTPVWLHLLGCMWKWCWM